VQALPSSHEVPAAAGCPPGLHTLTTRPGRIDVTLGAARQAGTFGVSAHCAVPLHVRVSQASFAHVIVVPVQLPLASHLSP
jgi:hypothetical protein